jgi:hypothetical protein
MAGAIVQGNVVAVATTGCASEPLVIRQPVYSGFHVNGDSHMSFNPHKVLPVGVQICGNKFRLLLSIAGRKRHCGCFATVSDAVAARDSLLNRLANMPMRSIVNESTSEE